MDNINTLVAGILENSEFLNVVRSLKQGKTKSRLFGNAVRHLSEDEISRLKAQGNKSSDWNALLVADGFRTDYIAETIFSGACVLGLFDGMPLAVDISLALPSGIYKSTIVDSEIGSNSLVCDSTVARYCVGEQAVVYRIGALLCSGNCSFGNGREIFVGIETGGREVMSYADMTISVAQTVATRRSDRELLAGYRDFATAYAAAALSAVGFAGSKSVTRNSPRIIDTFIGPGSIIDGAVLVENSTILCTPEEKTHISHGAFVRNSCVQWGCEVTTMAIVDDSVLTEYSHVERHGKVTQSIIGPNTGIAEGEVTSCLVGPFVGFHHQALLIAAIWPEGKGNVAYGANVGSNHTSKAPDQEIWCGEGTFFGLGANVKFPSDFTGAPYSIISTGVETLPQRVEFPFCLINKPLSIAEGMAPSINEIFPGWVLSDNIYTVKRNEGKYLKRNKAKRSAFAFDVFRPDIMDLLVKARDRLRGVTTKRAHYTAADMPGLGKNYMTEESRTKGVATYSFYIEYYCLCGLGRRIAAGCDAATVYRKVTNDDLWEYQRELCARECLSDKTVKENLLRLVQMHEKVAIDTQRAKEKDDERGRAIINDYDHAHTSAEDDSFVKETWEKTNAMNDELERIIAQL